jgi:hypothetical protein
MKNKYESPIQREILIVYAIAFLTDVACIDYFNNASNFSIPVEFPGYPYNLTN